MIHKSGIVNGKREYQTPMDRPDCLEHATDLEYQISSHDVWRPGVYDSERAARYAFRFDDGDLQALQDSVNPGGIITFEMLRGLRRQNEEGER